MTSSYQYQWTLHYGHDAYLWIDVSAVARTTFMRSSQPLLLLPRSDSQRTAIFGDPLYGVVKVLRLRCRITGNTWDIPADTAAQVRLSSPSHRLIDQVSLCSVSTVDQKLDTLLAFLQRDNNSWNRMQQRMMLQYGSGEEHILEIGPTKHFLLQHRAFQTFQSSFHFVADMFAQARYDTLIVHAAQTMLDIVRRHPHLLRTIDLLLVSHHTLPALSAEEKRELMDNLSKHYLLFDCRPQGEEPDALQCHQLWLRRRRP